MGVVPEQLTDTQIDDLVKVFLHFYRIMSRPIEGNAWDEDDAWRVVVNEFCYIIDEAMGRELKEDEELRMLLKYKEGVLLN